MEKAMTESSTDLYDYEDDVDSGDKSPFKTANGRYCYGGMSKCGFCGLMVFIGFAVFIAIMVPVIFISIGSNMAQSTTDNTVIEITKASIVWWGQNYKDTCGSKGECTMRLKEGEGNDTDTCQTIGTPTCNSVPTTIPNLLIMNQTLRFSNVAIPGVIQSGRFDMLYTVENMGNPEVLPGTEGMVLIGDLYVPEIDLHGLEDGVVTIEDIEVILRVRDPSFFSTMAALKTAPGMGGIWNMQSGTTIVEANLLGTLMYYKATMASMIYNADLWQCDGPMALMPSFSKECPCNSDCIVWEH
ncbi:hypothetical protein SARC_07859 [Sphaeroforma arctica JP610]|uniref:Uncharacterized protein n=1 Tax=Sphaeroforma arctica JP610 TaxID=667725 RepID=A0A0L0FSH0_9EUKA|nr:hypothetical protein SARC_07859 [Sphaeroforma arctica JP610]KNC79747.1 hypothetical protein SARC_07859 [Sphaeroforma arctica JP610]|eukprot:XP_014153649.1 hypothetical protein SARC_07859 [Sphaeroforma arctica JP610]